MSDLLEAAEGVITDTGHPVAAARWRDEVSSLEMASAAVGFLESLGS
jgi:hypothetical protein